MKRLFLILTLMLFFDAPAIRAEETAVAAQYTVGIDDVLDIAVLQPEQLMTSVTVAPDGTINFAYIGNVKVDGLTLAQIQEDIQKRLADGYMRYPVVAVSLKETHSRKFFVYGEVVRPGTFPLNDNTTTLKAISMAGGLTKFGSSSRVKILRPYKDKPGYEAMKVNLKEIMNGDAQKDIVIQSGDMIVVSEGAF